MLNTVESQTNNDGPQCAAWSHGDRRRWRIRRWQKRLGERMGLYWMSVRISDWLYWTNYPECQLSSGQRRCPIRLRFFLHCIWLASRDYWSDSSALYWGSFRKWLRVLRCSRPPYEVVVAGLWDQTIRHKRADDA